MVPSNCLLFCDAILSVTPNLSKSLHCSGEWHLEKLKEDGLLLSPHGVGETRTAVGDDSEKHTPLRTLGDSGQVWTPWVPMVGTH